MTESTEKTIPDLISQRDNAEYCLLHLMREVVRTLGDSPKNPLYPTLVAMLDHDALGTLHQADTEAIERIRFLIAGGLDGVHDPYRSI